jgi:hypothetical protein
MYEAQQKRANQFPRNYQSPYSSQFLVKQSPSKQSIGRRRGKHDKAGTLNMEFLAEAVQNIAEEKISQLLLPLVSSLTQKNMASSAQGGSDKTINEEAGNLSTSPSNTSRVTASPEVRRITPPCNSFCESPETTEESEPVQEIKSSIEKVQKIAKNVQYTTIKSNEDSDESPKAKKSVSKIPTRKSLSKEKVEAKKLMKAKYEEAKQLAIKERNAFIEALTDNPMYVNEFFPQPWREMSK